MAVLVVYGTRRAVPLKYLAARPALHGGPADLAGGLHRGHLLDELRRRPPGLQAGVDHRHHRQLRARGPGAPRYKLSVAVKEGADPVDRRPRLPAHRPAGRPSRSATVKGLEDLPVDGVEKTPIGKITEGPRLHDPQRPAGQRPQQGPVRLRRSHERRWRHQARRPLRGLRGQADRQLRHGRRHAHRQSADPATVYVPSGRPLGPKDGQGDALAQGWKENVGLGELPAHVHRRDASAAGFVEASSSGTWSSRSSRCSRRSCSGMLLALLFNDPRLRGKAIYRSAADPPLRPAGLRHGAGVEAHVQPGLRPDQPDPGPGRRLARQRRGPPRPPSSSPTCGWASPTCSSSAPAPCSRSPRDVREAATHRRRQRLPHAAVDHHAAAARGRRPAAASRSSRSTSTTSG